jgi:hypothetical protein
MTVAAAVDVAADRYALDHALDRLTAIEADETGRCAVTGHGGDRRSEAFKSTHGLEQAEAIRRIPRQRRAEFQRIAQYSYTLEEITAHLDVVPGDDRA